MIAFDVIRYSQHFIDHLFWQTEFSDHMAVILRKNLKKSIFKKDFLLVELDTVD